MPSRPHSIEHSRKRWECDHRMMGILIRPIMGVLIRPFARHVRLSTHTPTQASYELVDFPIFQSSKLSFYSFFEPSRIHFADTEHKSPI